MHTRLVGAAGLGYVVLAGLENIDLLDQPGPGSSAGVVQQYFTANPAGLRLAGVAGVLSLICYVAFVVGLWWLAGPRRGWAAQMLLAAGLTGAGLGGLQLMVRVTAIADPARVDVTDLVRLRAGAGVLIGLTVLGAGLVTAGQGLVPRWLGRFGAGTGAVVTVLSALALGDQAWSAAAVAGFVAAAAWTGAAATAMVMPRGLTAPAALAWLIFFVVSLAAGVSGLALLAFPGSTGSYFSWPLAPPALAATIGASYLVASVVYGLGLRRGGLARRWSEAQSLLVGIVALSVPILLTTLNHLEVFDFTRWQAWAWLVLFGAFPVAAVVALWWGRAMPGRLVTPGWGWVGYAAVLLVAAAVLWVRPHLTDALPVGAAAFGTRVLAAWFLLAAVLALAEAVRPSRPTLVAGWLFPLAWALGPLRVDAGPSAALWYGGIAALLLLATAQTVARRP